MRDARKREIDYIRWWMVHKGGRPDMRDWTDDQIWQMVQTVRRRRADRHAAQLQLLPDGPADGVS